MNSSCCITQTNIAARIRFCHISYLRYFPLPLVYSWLHLKGTLVYTPPWNKTADKHLLHKSVHTLRFACNWMLSYHMKDYYSSPCNTSDSRPSQLKDPQLLSEHNCKQYSEARHSKASHLLGREIWPHVSYWAWVFSPHCIVQGVSAHDTWLHELLSGFVSQSIICLQDPLEATKSNIILPSQSMHVRTYSGVKRL